MKRLFCILCLFFLSSLSYAQQPSVFLIEDTHPANSTSLNDSSRTFSSSGGAETETLTIDGAVMETATATARAYTGTTYVWKDASGNTILSYSGGTWTLQPGGSNSSIVLADSGTGEYTMSVDGGTVAHYTAAGGWDFYSPVDVNNILNITAPAAATTGLSTVTQATTTLTLATSADAALAYTGATVTTAAATCHVIGVTGALIRTCAESQTIAAGTALTSIQGPATVIKDASGSGLHVFYADGACAHISAAGVGLGFRTVDGKEGIGIMNPGFNLEVQGTTNSILRLTRNPVNAAVTMYADTANRWSVGIQGATLTGNALDYVIYDETAAVVRMVIKNSTGNVIINPAAANGYGYTFTAASVAWELTPVTGSLRADNTAWQFTPTFEVDVAALAPVAAYIGNDGTLGFSSSTIEAKKNVADIPTNVTVDNMRVIQYEPRKRNIVSETVQVPYQEVVTVKSEAGDYTETVTKYREETHRRVDGYKDEGAGYTRYGLVAEEMAKTHPELVYANGKGVDYEQIIPLLIKEIQALKARVHKLEEINVAERRVTP